MRSTGSRAVATAAGAAALVIAASCHDIKLGTSPSVPSVSAARIPSASTVDGAHVAGNPHFFFLPPLALPPHYSGESDPDQFPNVVICEWTTQSGGACARIIAAFSRDDQSSADSDIKYNTATQSYRVNWHTSRCIDGPCDLDPAKTYRLRVLLGPVELGHIEVFAETLGKEPVTNTQSELHFELSNGTLPIVFRIEKRAITASFADPTLLPRATSQHPAASTYGRALSAGETYIDPNTGVTVLKVTDASTPTANAGMYHGYSEGGPTISQPWTGADGETYYTAAVNDWLVDIRYSTLTPVNWRPVQYWGEIGLAFSLDPQTPRVAYLGSSTRVDRYNTATNQIENTGHWPWLVTAGEYLDWLQTQVNDEWLVGMLRSNQTIVAFRPSDGLQRTITSADAGVSIDEPHLDREFPQVYIASTAGVKNKIFNLETATYVVPNDPTGIVEDSHGAAMRGKIVAMGNWTANAIVATYRDGSVRAVVTPAPTDVNGDYHLAGQWVFNNPNEYFIVDQWARGGPNAIYRGMIGFASTANDVRLLAAHDAVGTDYETGGQPHPTLAPDGKLVMWTSNMNGSSRFDTFIARVPARQ